MLAPASSSTTSTHTSEEAYQPMALLRIAVPNKGSLSEAATEILPEAGYRQRDDTKELSLTDPDNGVEFYYLRPRDIAVYVGEGTLDVGITGRDLVLDSHADADEVLGLGFGGTFRFAGPPGVDPRHGPRGQADRHLVRRHRPRAPGREQHRGVRDEAGRRGRDQHPARRRGRDRRRRRDR